MIIKPSDIIYHIIGVELDNPDLSVDNDGLTEARNAHDGWKMGFTVNKKINSKKLIEGIAKESKLFPFFKGDKLSFNSLKDTYGETDITPPNGFTIKDADVISYKFDRTKIEDVKTKVILNYHLDYATDEFKKSTESNADDGDTAAEFFTENEEGYLNSYYGIEEDQADGSGGQGGDPIEVKYIRHNETAEKLQRFLLAWYCNQHNTCKVKLPLNYLYSEVGDIVAFSQLLSGKKAYGEDYSLESYQSGHRTVRNGQEILPYWMIMGVSKTLEYVELDLIQLHYLNDGISLPPDNGDDNGDGNGDGGEEFPEEWGEYFAPELSLEVFEHGRKPGRRIVFRANAIVWGEIENSSFTWDINPPVVQEWHDVSAYPVPWMFHGVNKTVGGATPYTQQGLDLMQLCIPLWINLDSEDNWINLEHTISCTVTDPTGITVNATADIILGESEWGEPHGEWGWGDPDLEFLVHKFWAGVGVLHGSVSGEIINSHNQFTSPVSCRKVDFTAEGGTKEFKVTTLQFGEGWALNPELSDWCSISPNSQMGNEQQGGEAFSLFIDCSVNETISARQEMFRVIAGGDEWGGFGTQIGTVIVYQSGTIG
jgi:hypothetical protein